LFASSKTATNPTGPPPTYKAPPCAADEKTCFWGGWGGSMVVMCPDRRTTISYVMNKMGPGILGSERMATYGTLIFDTLTSG
jgi:CubicO group peptidase (beta-lactamase class C family)